MTLATSDNGLQLLRSYLGLTTNTTYTKNIDDLVFIAIDFEHLNNFKPNSDQNRKSQAGIAILDTRNLSSSNPTPISTFHFATGSLSYYNRCQKSFLFGTTVMIHQKDVCQNLEALISRKRNNILIGHDIENESKTLRTLNFDLDSSIVGMFDTQRLSAAQINPHTPAKSLRDLLKNLQCPFAKLHNAGNDAHFTLRALIMLATRNYPSPYPATINIDDNIQTRLTALNQISQSPLPTTGIINPAAKEKGKEKKQKKGQQQQLRKREPHFQDSEETIERKRAERRERRLKLENDQEQEQICVSQTDSLDGVALLLLLPP